MAGKLKVGVIGVGGISRVHFPGWIESPHAELVALADTNKAVLDRVGDELGIDRRYTEGYDLIDQPDLDIVDVIVPNMFHTPLTIAALEAGKHVICEKPLAVTPEEVEQMIAARDKAGTLLMTAQHFRFEGTSEAMRDAVNRGLLGNIYHARSWMLRRNLVPLSLGFLRKANSGGGPCIDIGVHILDLTLWFMGHPKPVAVSGITRTDLLHQKDAFSNWGGRIPKNKEIDVEEFACAMVRFENGASLLLEVSWIMHHKVNGDHQVWLYGDKGGAHWPSIEVFTSDNKTMQHMDTQLLNFDTRPPHAKECMAFAEAVAKGKDSPVPPEHSLDLVRILDGLYKSAEQGKEIRLD
jgi:predicted dehydrogenase